MKQTLGILAGVFLSLTPFAQGTITWNPSTYTTNDFQGHTGLISGVNHYRFGLYVGPAGAPAESLLLVGLTTNSPTIPETFIPVGNSTLPLVPNGSEISFQVRGWSFFAGPSYESAFSYATGGGVPLAYLGVSGIGAYIVGSGVPLQSAPFLLTPIPEPCSLLLGALGVLVTLLLYPRRARGENLP